MESIFVTDPEICQSLKISKSKRCELTSQGLFPPPIHGGGLKRSLWLREELDLYCYAVIRELPPIALQALVRVMLAKRKAVKLPTDTEEKED